MSAGVSPSSPDDPRMAVLREGVPLEGVEAVRNAIVVRRLTGT